MSHNCPDLHYYSVCIIKNILLLHFLVPTPVVNISAPNNLTTGQSVTLDCSIVAVRGITSRVDIVWYGNGIQVRRIDNITASIINGTTAVYMDSLNISSLTRQYDGRLYSCQAIINNEPPTIAFSSIRLNVTCKFTAKLLYSMYSTICVHSWLF